EGVVTDAGGVDGIDPPARAVPAGDLTAAAAAPSRGGSRPARFPTGAGRRRRGGRGRGRGTVAEGAVVTRARRVAERQAGDQRRHGTTSDRDQPCSSSSFSPQAVHSPSSHTS